MSALIDAFSWRYATKKFDASKKISESDLADLTEAMRLAPSSYGIQPWKFIIVTDPAIRTALQAASWNQSQVTEASHLIVLCAKKTLTEADIDHMIEVTAQTHGMPTVEPLAAYKGMMMGSLKGKSPEELTIWNQKQVYIALGFLMAAAAEKKIDSCPMEGFDSAKYDEILGLSALGLTSTVVCPVGYRSSDDKNAAGKKVRFSTDEVIIKR